MHAEKLPGSVMQPTTSSQHPKLDAAGVQPNLVKLSDSFQMFPRDQKPLRHDAESFDNILNSSKSSKTETPGLAAYMLKQNIVNQNNFVFKGSSRNYVKFINHFKSCYVEAIDDPHILYTNLVSLLDGDALDTIEGATYLPPDQALDEALRLLKEKYGNKTVILEEHKLSLMTDGTVRDNLNDFSKLLTQLNTYKSVQSYVDPEATVGNFELITSILNRFYTKTSAAFMKKTR